MTIKVPNMLQCFKIIVKRFGALRSVLKFSTDHTDNQNFIALAHFPNDRKPRH